MNVRQFVEDLHLELDVSKRLDCPVCGRKHTFSVTKTLDGTKWFCFSASCGSKGVANSTLSIEDMEKLQGNKAVKHTLSIPEYWVSGLTNDSTIQYLATYNLIQMFKENHIDVRYDPKQDRHVFVSHSDRVVVGAYGRSASGAKPKWFNYMETEIPYIIRAKSNAGNEACIVEDPVSAAVVSNFIDGVSLLGVYLKRQYIPSLSTYDRVIVALDKDAGEKSLDIQRVLGYYTKVDIVLLDKDIKYMTPDEIRELIDG